MSRWSPWLVAVTAALLMAAADIGAEGDGDLIWSDEFSELNLQVWNHLVTGWRGGNQEFEYYRNNRKNSYIRDGILYILPTLTADEYGEDFLYNGNITDPSCNMQPCSSVAGNDIVLPIQSARMQSTYSFRYGRMEVRAQMPRGDWIWPAIWLFPKESYYGSWPASGEIDLIETRGNKQMLNPNGESEGIDKIGTTLHVGFNASYDVWSPTHWTKTLAAPADFASDFHVYELEWSKNCMRFKLDGEVYAQQPAPEGGFYKYDGLDKVPGATNIWANGEPLAPFDREFYIIMNVAVGGTYFPDGQTYLPYGRPWDWSSSHPMRDFWASKSNWYPTWRGEDAAMKVDYIRVYSNPSDFTC